MLFLIYLDNKGILKVKAQVQYTEPYKRILYFFTHKKDCINYALSSID